MPAVRPKIRRMSDAALPTWTWVLPICALPAVVLGLLFPPGVILAFVLSPLLIGTVLAAVYHAEAIAHRVGEPYGTLVLALAVTAIEVSLMVSMMLGGGPEVADLPRDTLFATVMIIVNGVVGLCLVVGGMRHLQQSFHAGGTGSALAALVAMSMLTMILPSVTVSSSGPTYSGPQLAFASIAALAMWSVYIYGQTVRHREHFQDVDEPAAPAAEHAPPACSMWLAGVLLVVALIGVVGLAKVLSPLISRGVEVIGAPSAVIGVAIALLVLLPETLAAVRAARSNRLQTSMNLALGSALATIGLTVPAVAVVATMLGLELNLGLDSRGIVLLLTSFLVCAITLGQGRSTIMQGAVHLVLFAAFLAMSLMP